MTNHTTYHCEIQSDGKIVCTPATETPIAGRSEEACVGTAEPEQEQCGITHYAGCSCHEKGWENKWKAAVEMAARAEIQRDILLAELRRIQNTYGHKSQDDCECEDCQHIRPIEEAIRAAQSPVSAYHCHPKTWEKVPDDTKAKFEVRVDAGYSFLGQNAIGEGPPRSGSNSPKDVIGGSSPPTC